MERSDAHEAAPESIRRIFKIYQKLPYDQLEGDPRVLDLSPGLRPDQQDIAHVAGIFPGHSLSVATEFLTKKTNVKCAISPPDVRIYEVNRVPGESISYDWRPCF